MEENILTWSVANWITVVLMAMLGFAIIAVLGKLARKNRAASSDE